MQPIRDETTTVARTTIAHIQHTPHVVRERRE